MTSAVRARDRLAVRIWLGIGGVFAVLAIAVTLCIGGLVTAFRAIDHTAVLSAAERHAVAIGVAAREQYMHDSHGVLLRDQNHLGHEHHWATMLAEHVQHLRPLVQGPELKRLEAIQSDSSALTKVFTEEIFPAALAKDDAGMRRAHVDAETRVEAMIKASDDTVAQLSSRTREAVQQATRAISRAIVLATLVTALAGLIALLLAIGFAKQIVTPVASLNGAAGRIGQGDFRTEVPRQPTYEFEQLAAGVRAMAERLNEREARVLQAERLATVGAIAAGVAHELNNPLGVMLGYLTRLHRRELPKDVAEELRIVDDEAQQCRRIVEDLVTFAREPRLEKRTVDVAALVREICERIGTIPEMEGHQVECTGAEIIEASLDATRIGQVVRNVILNAALASPAGREIAVRVERYDGQAQILVRDRGAGIEPADLPHVFEPFYSGRSGGTGLGLAVSQGIVRTHGGSIEIESVRGEGTTVWIRIPLEEAS